MPPSALDSSRPAPRVASSGEPSSPWSGGLQESMRRRRELARFSRAQRSRNSSFIMRAASGISLVTSSGGPAEVAEAARLAERAGFTSVWATEFYDRSATIAMAAMAAATDTIELGSAIAYAFGRTPLVLA